nr:GTP-binding protein [Anaerocolumna sedimenticola]
MNEFGSIGIDGRLIEKEGIELIEINNGSIFCSCLKGSFVKALIELSKSDIDLLLIENSGMADPSNMHQILDELKNKTYRSLNYKGAVCIVDSVNFLKLVRVLAPVQNQIASSNFIIINKIDKADQSMVMEIEKKIHGINLSAFIYKTIYSEVPIPVLEEKLIDNGYLGETSNRTSNRPATYSLESDEIFMEEKIKKFIQIIENYSFRIKGFMKKSNNGWWQVDVVDGDVKIFEAEPGIKDILTTSKLAIVGKNTAGFKKEILNAWESVFDKKPMIYNDFDGCQINIQKKRRSSHEFKTVSIRCSL